MSKKYKVSVSKNKETLYCTVFTETEEHTSEITYALSPCYIVDNFWKNAEDIPRLEHITQIDEVKKAIAKHWSDKVRDKFKEKKEKEEVKRLLNKMEVNEQKLLSDIFTKKTESNISS